MTLSEINDITKSVDGTHWHIDVETGNQAIGISYIYIRGGESEACFVVWLKKDGQIKIDDIYEYVHVFNRTARGTMMSSSAADELLIVIERLKYSLLVNKLADLCCPNNEDEEET